MTYGLWCIRKCIQIILNHCIRDIALTWAYFYAFVYFIYLKNLLYTHTLTHQPYNPQDLNSSSRGQRSTGNGQEVDRGGLCWCLTAITGAEEDLPPGHTHTHARTQSCSRHTVMSPNPFPFLHKTTHRNILMHVYTHAHLLKPSHTHINTVGWYNVMWKLACLRAVCSPSHTFSPFVLPHRLNHTH